MLWHFWHSASVTGNRIFSGEPASIDLFSLAGVWWTDSLILPSEALLTCPQLQPITIFPSTFFGSSIEPHFGQNIMKHL
jgi:hypothetical protein